MKTEVGRNWYRWIHFNKLKGGLFGIFVCDIQHCFICPPSDSTVSEDAGTRTVATTALAVRRSNHLARSHTHFDKLSCRQVSVSGP